MRSNPIPRLLLPTVFVLATSALLTSCEPSDDDIRRALSKGGCQTYVEFNEATVTAVVSGTERVAFDRGTSLAEMKTEVSARCRAVLNFARQVALEKELRNRRETSVGQYKTPKGLLVIPGAAYIDGRDKSARPPVTVMNVNVWRDAQTSSTAQCQLPHGSQVDIVSAFKDVPRSRLTFEIRGSVCSGWVSDAFLAPKKRKPVGSRVQ